MNRKVRTLAFFLSFIFAHKSQAQGVSNGDQPIGGAPSNGIGTISATGSEIEQVNLTNGSLHVGIPLVRLKGVGIDTEIDYDFNSPDLAAFEITGVNFSNVGFKRSGEINWAGVYNVTVDQNGDIDDPGDTGDDDCDDDGGSCNDPCGDPGTGCGEQAHPSYSPDTTTSQPWSNLINAPFTSSDGGGTTLKQPVVIQFPDQVAAAEYPNLYATDGSYLKYTPALGVVYPDGVHTYGARGGMIIGESARTGVILESPYGDRIYCQVTQAVPLSGGTMNVAAGLQICTDTRARQITFTLDGLENVIDIAYPNAGGEIEHVAITYQTVQSTISPYKFSLPIKILYPDQSHYDFEYAPNEIELKKIWTPSGGYIRYEYQDPPSAQFVVAGRFLSPDGTAASEQAYSYAFGNPANCTEDIPTFNPWTKVIDPERRVETYTHPNGPITFVDYTLADQNGTILASKHIDWEYNETSGEFSKGSLRCMPHNPRPHDEIDTDDAGNTTITTYSYDALNNVTEKVVADSSGNVYRDSAATFVDATLFSPTGSAYFNMNILRLPLSRSVYGMGGNSSVEEYSYDEPTYSPSGAKGKVTTIVKTLDSTGSKAISHTWYEGHGIPYQIADPLGTITNLALDPSTLLPTQFTIGYGTSLAQISSLNYDASLAMPNWIKNPNDIAAAGSGKIFTYDADGRVRRIDYPDGGFATSDLVYGTGFPKLSVVELESLIPATAISTTTVLDGFGRTISKISADSSHIDTTYDDLGRKQYETNPYWAVASLTDARLYNQYDSLGRLNKRVYERKMGAVYSDVSLETWISSGLQSTYTDENAHVKKESRDLLGRLIAVQEPNPTTGALGATTTYQYDSLGNLTAIIQSGLSDGPQRIRRFLYDMSSRLIEVCNPEKLPSGASCDGNNWSEYYGYDEMGNLKWKKDSRGIVTHYRYDLLHRIVSKWYSNDPQKTLSSCYQYDSAINGIGLLGVSWTQAGECSSVLPTSGYQHATIILEYDLMGRVKHEKQCFLGACIEGSSGFDFTYQYNLEGDVAMATDGIGQLAWFPTYDSFGRLQQVTTTSAFSSDSLYPSQLFSASDAVAYGPGGLLTHWHLGAQSSGLSASREFDWKLRPQRETFHQ